MVLFALELPRCSNNSKMYSFLLDSIIQDDGSVTHKKTDAGNVGILGGRGGAG